jgi:hypothetical protein
MHFYDDLDGITLPCRCPGRLTPLPPHTRPETYLLDPPPPRVPLR